MNAKSIEALLKDYTAKEVGDYIYYLTELKDIKNSKGQRTNTWMDYKKDDWLADKFKQAKKVDELIDGKHVTLLNIGVSYDYVAYKNRMLRVYSDSIIDVQLVYKGDVFSFTKKDGKVNYNHKIANPFGQKDEDIVGGYCVIKNKRGEFLTTLSPKDIAKHRKSARGDAFWQKWFKEMCLKTIIKKGCKTHFDDIFTEMNEEDNKQYDLENDVVNIELEKKQEIEAIDTVPGLTEYYKKQASKPSWLVNLLANRKKELLDNINK